MQESLPTYTRFFIYAVFAFLFSWITLVEAILDEGERLVGILPGTIFNLFIFFVVFVFAGKLARIMRLRLKRWPLWVSTIYPRFSIDFALVILQTLLFVGLLKYLSGLFSFYSNLQPFIQKEEWVLFGFPFVIFSLVWLVEGALDLFSQRQNLLTQNQLLEKEHLSSQIQSLKNQLRPHFLFNNLNAISNLVYKDAETADLFTQKLANIYRYVLEVNDEIVISLDKELQFIENYLQLQYLRFEGQIIFENRISEKDRNYLVPPLSLELLVENAIKHNKLSREKPLLIIFDLVDRFLIVRNSFHPKRKQGVQSRKGLNNLARRYELLGTSGFKAEIIEPYFVVYLPLIEPES